LQFQIQLVALRHANHKATQAALLKMASSTSIAFGKRGSTGGWASSTSVAPGQMKDSLHATLEASKQHVAAAGFSQNTS
jgi:hypothetical protein